ncbi:nuclear transport factor 2 family protein [Streptacidiphilus rugosus]|uniref:nuclear transport factor 2 family protein n=1 Tax=Streptacidiphilus rugosus TaxID=405783 RepID=UPI00068F67F6|nr:nuclear transport factor 2 family protein [Streptacidiphilus rugosus]
MNPAPISPAQDLRGYLHTYLTGAVFGDEPPDVLFDRFHTPDFEQLHDGALLDRDKLVAHTRPARRNVTALHLNVHDALVDGDRVAAHYTLRTTMRRGPELVSEVWLFGNLAPDGRLHRIVSTSRTDPVRTSAADQAATDRATPSPD